MAGATTPKPTATANATAVRTATSRGRPANGWRGLLTRVTLTGPQDTAAHRPLVRAGSGGGRAGAEHPDWVQNTQSTYVARIAVDVPGLEATP